MVNYLSHCAPNAQVNYQRRSMSGNKFSKMHYQFIADVIRTMPIAKDNKEVIIKVFARALMADNPTFNTDKFIGACNGIADIRRRVIR
jgi:hypothetical protein